MKKFTLITVLAFVCTVFAQESLILQCQFPTSIVAAYTCRLNGIEILDPDQEIIISGEHLENRTNADVEYLIMRNSNTPFMIPQIFTTFPNMKVVDIQNCNLQSINIPESVQLLRLIVGNNNISRIVNGTFSEQRNLEYFSAIDAGIQVIEDDAFVGLQLVTLISLINNQISELSARMFAPLASLRHLDLERNQLTRIDDLFSMNLNLTTLFLEGNQINEISPQFTRVLGNSLDFINLSGNLCINRSFSVGDEIGLVVLHNALNSCFNNFVGEVRETRRITLEFQGPLSLFDEFGNIIGRIN